MNIPTILASQRNKNKWISFNSQKITVKSFLFLGILGLSALLSFLFLKFHMNFEGATASAVNYSGKQRMLSQRSGTLALRMSETQDTAHFLELKADLMQVISEMELIHSSLLNGNEQLQLTPLRSPDTQAIFFSESVHLDHDFRKYVEQLKAILQVSTAQEITDHPQFSKIRDTFESSSLLNKLDQLTNQIEQENISKLKRIEYVQSAIFILMLLVLAGTWFSLIRPMFIKIKSQFRNLEAAKEQWQIEALKHKRTAETLKESEEKYKQLFSAGSEAILILDAETYQILDINDAALDLYGYSRQDFLTRGLLDICIKRIHEGEQKEILNLAGKSIPLEYHIKKDGSLFAVEIDTASFIWQKRLMQFISVKDISKHVEYEQILEKRTRELENSNQELQQTMSTLKSMQEQLIMQEKMASLGGLVAGIAHEINTPIGVSVTAASHMGLKVEDMNKLYESGELAQEDLEEFFALTKESMEMINFNLNRASELIKSFKRVAIDRSNEEKGTFLVEEYLNEIVSSLRPKLKKTKHKIDIQCPLNLEIKSFPGAFSQIITNLVMNSLHHGFSWDGAGTITIEAEAQENQMCLKYSDNGKGIPKEVQSKIFDPFFTTKRAFGGTGLGLHIIYNIITQQMGGSIECKSEPDQGVLFTILLPGVIIPSD